MVKKSTKKKSEKDKKPKVQWHKLSLIGRIRLWFFWIKSCRSNKFKGQYWSGVWAFFMNIFRNERIGISYLDEATYVTTKRNPKTEKELIITKE